MSYLSSLILRVLGSTVARLMLIEAERNCATDSSISFYCLSLVVCFLFLATI